MNSKFHINNVFFKEPLSLGEVKILQIGRRYCSPSETVGEHTHGDFYELSVITGGAGVVITDKFSTPISTGEVILSLNNERHDLLSSEDSPLKYDFIAFCPQTEELKNAFLDLSKRLKDNARVFKNETVEVLLKNMIAELLISDDFSNEVLTLSAKQILLLTLRAFCKNNAVGDKITPAHAQILCYQVMTYIDNHVTSIKTLTEVSDNFLYNYTYLSALFKNTTGRSLKEYFSSVKLKLAKDTLDNSSLTITEVAELCNFSSVYTFSRAFKEFFNISPENYRKTKK